jgi:undecaprenyl-diphosphatase
MRVAEWIKVIILGIVEGITEFLPISSTGHLLVLAALLDYRSSLNSTFEIFIQFGAVLAVIFYYRTDLLHQIRNARTDPSVRRLWFLILLAFIPAGIVGFFLDDWITANLVDTSSNALIVAAALMTGGVIFLLVERRPHVQSPAIDLSQVTPRQAVLIGFAQVAALIPGVSRSGASIVSGMMTGLSRETATQFSFYLAIPTLGIATIYKLITSLDRVNPADFLYLLLGTGVSAAVAWVSIGWLLRYVSRGSFVPFGFYRIATGIMILVLIVSRVLPV